MTFSIDAVGAGSPTKFRCELVIGDHKESIPLITTLWTAEAYKSHWLNAIEALVGGKVERCALITDFQPSDQSVGVTYWALFNEDDVVYFQERFSRDANSLLTGLPLDALPHIPARKQGTPEEQSLVSEWVASIADLQRFIEQYHSKISASQSD